MLHNVIALAPNTDKLGTELAIMSLIALVIGRELARLPEMTAATIDQIADRVVPVIDCYLHD